MSRHQDISSCLPSPTSLPSVQVQGKMSKGPRQSFPSLEGVNGPSALLRHLPTPTETQASIENIRRRSMHNSDVMLSGILIPGGKPDFRLARANIHWRDRDRERQAHWSHLIGGNAGGALVRLGHSSRTRRHPSCQTRGGQHSIQSTRTPAMYGRHRGTAHLSRVSRYLMQQILWLQVPYLTSCSWPCRSCFEERGLSLEVLRASQSRPTRRKSA